MKQTSQLHEYRGIHSRKRVIGHYAQPSRKTFKLANRIGLEDIEQAEQSEGSDHRNDRGGQRRGHEREKLAADFIDDDLLRVFESADLAGPTGCPDPNREDHNVKNNQEYKSRIVRQSHQIRGGHVDGDA